MAAKTEFVLRIGYGSVETPDALADIIGVAKRARCDRVMLFNSRGHVEPAHLDRDEILRRADVLREATAAFRKAGFGVGINNLATIGMNFSPPRKHRLPFQNLVDYDGAVFTETFCPLGEDFRDYIEFLFRAWASVGADEVWVDDDFRYKDNAAQCFCPLHLAEFGRATGKKWTREALVKAITAPGPGPNELARKWGELQVRGLLAAARAIARGVHRTAPKMRIGFMGVNLSVHNYGSEYLRKLCKIFNPCQTPLIRPEYGAYSDQDRAAWSAYVPVWSSRRALGDDFLPWPELETWPGTPFNHSRKVARMKLAWGAVQGFSSSTINGVCLPEDVRMVARAKTFVQAISAALSDAKLRPRGVSLELSESRITLRPKPGPATLEWDAPRVLSRLGLPLWPDGGCGRVLVGNAPLVRARELKAFAREGMLLDRPAFEMLASMERDDVLGGARSRPMGGVPVLERFADTELNGAADGHVMSMEMAIPVRPQLKGFDLPASRQFTVLSWFEDADGERLSPAVWARRWRGGRLVVLPFSLNEPASQNAILNADRKAQVESLIEWAAGEPLPVRIEGAADLAVVYRASARGERVVVALANFSLDDAARFWLTLPALSKRRKVSVRAVGSPGRARRVPVASGGRVEMKGGLGVPSQEARVFEFTARA